MMNAAHTAKAKHFRNRLKHEGIAAKCKAYVSCGVQFIQVSVDAYDSEFTEVEQGLILVIAQVNGLTLSRGMQIDLTQRTYSKQATFVLA